MGKTRGRRGNNQKRKKQRKTTENISKKDKRHLVQFGESHPIADGSSSAVGYKKIVDNEENNADLMTDSEDEEDAATINPYQQLISSIMPAQQHDGDDEENDDYSDDEDDGNNECDDDATYQSMNDERSGELAEEASEETDGEPEMMEKTSHSLEASQEVDDEEMDSDDYWEDEDAEGPAEVDIEKNEDGANDSDPFVIHFDGEIEEKLANLLEEKKADSWTTKDEKIPGLGKSSFCYPKEGVSSTPDYQENDLQKLNVKQVLCKNLHEKSKGKSALTAFQQGLFSVLNSYRDIYYPERTHKNAQEIRTVYCLHALNHVLKTRSRVIAHNNKIKSKKDDIPEDYRDQGLTRPKVLIILPFRDAALQVVQTMVDLLMPKDQSYVSNKKRFEKEFGSEGDDVKGKKPEDFEAIFAGNIDDHFRLGLGISKKSLKLYTDFYSSDIILASPLGIRTVTSNEEEGECDSDFLSSIEMLIFDQTDVYLMQNWDHVLHLMSQLHLQPKDSHGVDFSRVRMWMLNGWSHLYRQTAVFSSLSCPEINALFNRHCHNYSGKLQLQKLPSAGSICQIVTQLPQVFHKIHCSSFKHLADERFEYFIKKILPQHRNTVRAQTMIFIPSYFDFVRVRNYFKREEIDFCQLSEYSKDKYISKARSLFFHGRIHFMLFSERFHFFRRYRIRGVKHLIFYSLPLYPHFYSEICNMLQDPKAGDNDNLTCTVLYSTFDAQRLAPVVGTKRAAHMINSDKNTHMFVTGGTDN